MEGMHIMNLEILLKEMEAELSRLKHCSSHSASPSTSSLDNFQILHSLGNAIHIMDTKLQIIFWNRGAEKLYGYAAEEILGKNVVEVLAVPCDHKLAYEILEGVLRGESWTGKFSFRTKSQDINVGLFTTTPLYDDKGTVIGLITYANDLKQFCEIKPPISSRFVLSKFSFDKYHLNAHNFAHSKIFKVSVISTIILIISFIMKHVSLTCFKPQPAHLFLLVNFIIGCIGASTRFSRRSHPTPPVCVEEPLLLPVEEEEDTMESLDELHQLIEKFLRKFREELRFLWVVGCV